MLKNKSQLLHNIRPFAFEDMHKPKLAKQLNLPSNLIQVSESYMTCSRVKVGTEALRRLAFWLL